MADPLTIAAIITAVVGTGTAVVQGNKAQEAQEEAQSAQAAQEEINQRNERLKQVREQRVATARAQQAAANIGIAGSSLEGSAVGSAATQAASNIATLEGKANTSKSISNSLFDASKAQTTASQVGSAVNLFNKLSGAGLFSNKPEVPTTTPSTRPIGPLQ